MYYFFFNKSLSQSMGNKEQKYWDRCLPARDEVHRTGDTKQDSWSPPCPKEDKSMNVLLAQAGTQCPTVGFRPTIGDVRGIFQWAPGTTLGKPSSPH